MTKSTDRGAGPSWHGTYLDEDGIVADALSKIKGDPETVKLWLDEDSFLFPQKGQTKETAGSLMFVGMGMRNYYGLWHLSCPHTETVKCEITDGIITDPRHPDNLSGRVLKRIKETLAREYPK